MNEVSFESLKKCTKIGKGICVKQISENTFAYYKYAGFGENYTLKIGIAVDNILTTDITMLSWDYYKMAVQKFFLQDTRLLIKSKAPFNNLSMPLEAMKETDKDVSVTVIEYSPLSYLILGDTRPIKDSIKSIGAIFGTRFKHPKTKETVTGWIVSKSKATKLKELNLLF